MNESNYCFMTKISLIFTFITNEIIRSELYILNLFEGHCGVNFSNFIFQRLENAQIEKWIFFPFCFGILFLWPLFEQSYQNIEKSHLCLEDKALVILWWVVALNCPLAMRLWQPQHCGEHTNCVIPSRLYFRTYPVFTLWYITLWFVIILF